MDCPTDWTDWDIADGAVVAAEAEAGTGAVDAPVSIDRLASVVEVCGGVLPVAVCSAITCSGGAFFAPNRKANDCCFILRFFCEERPVLLVLLVLPFRFWELVCAFLETDADCEWNEALSVTLLAFAKLCSPVTDCSPVARSRRLRCSA